MESTVRSTGAFALHPCPVALTLLPGETDRAPSSSPSLPVGVEAVVVVVVVLGAVVVVVDEEVVVVDALGAVVTVVPFGFEVVVVDAGTVVTGGCVVVVDVVVVVAGTVANVAVTFANPSVPYVNVTVHVGAVPQGALALPPVVTVQATNSYPASGVSVRVTGPGAAATLIGPL